MASTKTYDKLLDAQVFLLLFSQNYLKPQINVGTPGTPFIISSFLYILQIKMPLPDPVDDPRGALTSSLSSSISCGTGDSPSTSAGPPASLLRLPPDAGLPADPGLPVEPALPDGGLSCADPGLPAVPDRGLSIVSPVIGLPVADSGLAASLAADLGRDDADPGLPAAEPGLPADLAEGGLCVGLPSTAGDPLPDLGL